MYEVRTDTEYYLNNSNLDYYAAGISMLWDLINMHWNSKLFNKYNHKPVLYEYLAAGLTI